MMKLIKLAALVFVIILSACTDYVSQIEDERDEWRSAREQAALLSSGEVEEESSSSSSAILSSGNHEKSSSSSVKSNGSSSSVILSGDSREESSSSAVKSCSSEKTAASSSSKDLETAEGYSSSSEDVVLSSSSKKDESSSSSKKVESSSSISYGILIDERDGQTYRTVAIGSQVWLAENLNYEMDNSYCYENSDDKCAKYGRLYKLSASKNACPNGWHLPLDTEFETLISIAGEKATAAKKLKSVRGWNNNGNGLDALGFSVLPAGMLIIQGVSLDYGSEGNDAFFWSASEDVSGAGHYMYLYYNDTLGLSRIADMYAFSIRCLKDENELPKSSSSISSSSSSKALWAYLNPAVSYGEIVDDRDGQVYKTVVIDEQTWMAENLNYRYEGKTIELDSSSFCYENALDSCSKYGRLYIWSAVVDSIELFKESSTQCGYGQECLIDSKIRGVCPEGWHVPNISDFEKLVDYAGGVDYAGEKLKSLPIGHWNNNAYGDDAFGFCALPAGIFFSNSMIYGSTRVAAHFWSISEKDNLKARIMRLRGDNAHVELTSYEKCTALSVRCLKD